MISQTRLNLKTNRVLKMSSHCWIQRWNYCCNYCREGIPASESVEDLIGLTQLQRLLNRACLRTFGAYAKRTCSVYVCAFTYITYKWRPRHRMILMHTMLHLPIYQFIHNSYSTYTHLYIQTNSKSIKKCHLTFLASSKTFSFSLSPPGTFPRPSAAAAAAALIHRAPDRQGEQRDIQYPGAERTITYTTAAN